MTHACRLFFVCAFVLHVAPEPSPPASPAPQVDDKVEAQAFAARPVWIRRSPARRFIERAVFTHRASSTQTVDQSPPLPVVAAAGVIVGFLTGVLGIAGGSLISPFLVARLKLDPRRAAATSTASTIGLSIISGVGVILRDPASVHTTLIALVVAAALPFVHFSARLRFRSDTLRALLITVVGLTGISYLWPASGASVRDSVAAAESPLRTVIGLLLSGGLVGFLNVWLGIGGGVVLVPILDLFFKLPLRVAKSTSLTAIPAISLFSASKRREFIDWALVRPIVGFGFLGAVGGLAAAPAMSKPLLRALLGWVLIASAGMLVRGSSWSGRLGRFTRRFAETPLFSPIRMLRASV